MYRLLPIDQHTAASPTVEIDRLITTQIAQYLRFLLQRDARGHSRRPPLYRQHDQPAIAGIADGATGMHILFPMDKKSFLLVGYPQGTIINEHGPTAYSRLQLSP